MIFSRKWTRKQRKKILRPGPFVPCVKQKIRSYRFINKEAATIPAVSARNLVSPSVTGRYWLSIASFISSGVKSPSGPMSICISAEPGRFLTMV